MEKRRLNNNKRELTIVCVSGVDLPLNVKKPKGRIDSFYTARTPYHVPTFRFANVASISPHYNSTRLNTYISSQDKK
jgi:hypothetical protein